MKRNLGRKFDQVLKEKFSNESTVCSKQTDLQVNSETSESVYNFNGCIFDWSESQTTGKLNLSD